MIAELMTAKEALQLIVENQECPALNYAVNYAKAGLVMDENSEVFKVQYLYVVGNISNWRAKKGDEVMKEKIKAARAAIKRVAAI